MNPTQPQYIIEPEESPYQVYEQSHMQKTFHYYISGVVQEPGRYVDMIHQIRHALPDDIVIIHINTPGGNLSTGIQIINAMKYSQAHIICSLEGQARSLGSLIFLAGDEFLTHDNTVMMIHNYSGGVVGKGNEQISEIFATKTWFDSIAYDYYVPFLTADELGPIIKGEDLWLHADDIRTRLKNMVTIQTAALIEPVIEEPPEK